MLPEENIDQLFRSALENANEIPPANAWQGISNQLSNVTGATQSVAAKSWFGKLGLISKVALISTTIISGVVAYELLKEEPIKKSIENTSSLEIGNSEKQVEINKIEQNTTEEIPLIDRGFNCVKQNPIEIAKQNIESNGITVYPPLSALNKDLSNSKTTANNDDLLGKIQSIISDKVAVQKPNAETSKVLENLIENGCKNKLVLNVVESDSSGKLVQVNCNGNVKKSSLSFGDGQELVFEGNNLSVNHFYKVNSRKYFYIKVVTLFSNGCKDSAFTSVEVNPSISMNEVMIPTVFTPNGDGKNDEYYLTIPEPKNFEMMIFDKGKKMIFYTNKFRDSWNGNCFGEPCMDGNYEVVIKTQYSGEKESVTTRWVNLNRN